MIGPDIPAHLLATTSSSAGPQLPPAGPQLPSTAGPQLPAGPSAPPPPTATADDDSSDDEFGPSLPPDLLAARAASKPILGPSYPTSYPPPRRPSPDSDDDFGPMPLPAGAQVSEESEGARLFREREERQKEKERKEKEGDGKPKREEWMLVPPKEMDLLASMDPTKLKSRTFAQNNKPHSAAPNKPGQSSGPNLWTETPQERMQRLEDEMMGRKRKAVDGGAEVEQETDEKRRKRERDAVLRDEVERHNKSSRNTSLLDQHSKSSKDGKKGGKDEKEVPGIWDRDRDMSVGGRLMDDGKRADVVKNAKELGGRFGGGSYL